MHIFHYQINPENIDWDDVPVSVDKEFFFTNNAIIHGRTLSKEHDADVRLSYEKNKEHHAMIFEKPKDGK